MDLDAMFFDINYWGFKISLVEWENLSYDRIELWWDRMKKTQAAEKRAMQSKRGRTPTGGRR